MVSLTPAFFRPGLLAVLAEGSSSLIFRQISKNWVTMRPFSSYVDIGSANLL